MSRANPSSAAVLRVIALGGDYFELCVDNTLAAPWRPGQFVMLAVEGAQDPYLKRPISIFREIPSVDPRRPGELRFLVKAVGRGTRRLRELAPGARLSMLGPLGNGFSPPEAGRRAVLVGGGIGVPPLVALGGDPMMRGVPITALVGGRTRDDLLGLDLFAAFARDLRLATEDGSAGHRGRVTDLLDLALDEPGPPPVVYACGPDGMLRAVGQKAVAAGIPCQLSLEAHMGCGFGVCLGCVVSTGENVYARVCKDGPVFEASRLPGYGGSTHGGAA